MHHSDRDNHRDGFRAAPTNKPWKRSRKRRVREVIMWVVAILAMAAAWSFTR